MSDAALLNHCRTYLETQLGPRPGATRHLPPPTVTVSRLTGTAGLAVAERLGAVLQAARPGIRAPWTVFHRSLVEKVLAEHNLPAKLATYMPEDRVSYIQDTLEELLGLHPSRTDLVTQVTETILGLAELGNCIIVGRGAHVILARHPAAFHVRLVSTLERRIERVVMDRKVNPDDAVRMIQEEDTARRRYLRTHFDADLDDPLAYHLTVNTDLFGVDETAELIGNAVLRHFPVQPA